MLHRPKLAGAFLVVLVWLAGPAAAQDTLPTTESEPTITLSVGDLSPPRAVDHWLKGEPVNGFERGTIYVIEFWATWCGPCIRAMPDLSWMQAKYPQVVFIGVDVLEKDAALVDPFMKMMSAKMQYRVAADLSPGDYKPGPMWTTWMEASGMGGIPCSFVIGADGRIADITNPTTVPHVLKRMLAGTFDLDLEAAAKAKAEPLYAAVYKASQAKDYDAALRSFDQLHAILPDRLGDRRRREILILKHDFAGVEALNHAFEQDVARDEVAPSEIDQFERDLLWLYREQGDAPAINRQTAALARKYAGDAEWLRFFAWILVNEPAGHGYRALPIDLDLVLKIAVDADEAAKHNDARALDTLARVHAVRGEFDAAVECERQAISRDSSGEYTAEFEKTIAKYRARTAD